MYTPVPFKITEIKTFTKDIKLLRLNGNMHPKPGEFLEVSVPGIGECPLASCSYNNNHIDLLTRNAGNVTSRIFQLQRGDTIFVRGPYGKPWPLKKLKNKNVILVAGGTGLAPITSLIEYIEKNRKDFKEIYIYFGFRNENYILLKDRIEKWKKKFNVTVSLDKKILKTEKFKCEIGFVHEVLAKHNPHLKNSIAVMCGPEIMMQCVTDKLISKGLKPNKIYWSLERRMECGFGSCGRCQLQDVYVCKDGPVFRYDIIKPKIDNENSSNEVKGG
jgi:anaerobic sulfite reductase subunit B